MTQSTGLKAVHDLLVAHQPDGAVHDPCHLCASEIPEPEEPMADKTYNEDDVRAAVEAAVAQATAPLQTRIGELQGAHSAKEQETAVEAAVAEAVGPLNETVADLTSRLDAAVAEARVAKENHDKLLAELKELEDARVEAEAVEARRDARVAEAREIAPWFNDEDVAERADLWAAKSDEEWTSQLSDYQALAAKFGDQLPGARPATTPPTTTAMTAADTSRATTGTRGALAELLSHRGTDLDPKSLR